MAKAVFNKGERVFVKPIGTWATIEKLVPQWVKGVEEPLKVYYDVGLGRDFQGHELAGESRDTRTDDYSAETWRLARVKNRWLTDGEALRNRHPQPGTYPVVVTDEQDWGGWRVPAAEYDRDPERIEFQARVMANGMRMLRLAREVAKLESEHQIVLPPEVKQLAALGEQILADIYASEPQYAQAANE